MLVRFHRPRHHYVIVVVIIIVTVLSVSAAGNGSGNVCSTLIGAYLEAAYKCAPGEFHEAVGCEWERLRLSCPKTKYLVIHSAQIRDSASSSTHSSCDHSRFTDSAAATDDHTSPAECSAVCVRQLFITPCQGRRRCSVETGSKRFRSVSTEACRPPAEARPKRSISVIYTCVVKSVLRSVFSNSSSHHSSPSLAPDPCPSVATVEAPSSPLPARSASVTRRPSLPPPPPSTPSPSMEFSRVVMVTPADAVVAAAVERDDEEQEAGPAVDPLPPQELDLTTQLVSLAVVTAESTQSPQRQLDTEETESIDRVSLSTVVMTTEDALTTPKTMVQLNWSTLWLNHLSSDWTWSYHFISENKEKFFLYLALAISLGFIFILFAIVLRLSFRKPLASDPADSPSHRCRCAGSLSPKADPGGSSARQPLTMSCTSPITWRLPDIDPSIAGDERPGRGCDVQLTSFNRLNSLPRLRRDSIVDVPPPPSPVSSSNPDHVQEVTPSSDAAVSIPPETLVSTTATISRSHLNFIDNQSFGQAPRPPSTNMASRPVTAVVTLPPVTADAGVDEASTDFTGTRERNGITVPSTDSSSTDSQFYQPTIQRDPSLAARVSVRPMAKFGSFGRTPGSSPCGQEYRELRQFSKTLQLPPGNHYFCT